MTAVLRSEARLRFVFDGAVATFPLALDATWQDIADIFSTIPTDRYGRPLAIDVRLPGETTADVDWRRGPLSGPIERRHAAPDRLLSSGAGGPSRRRSRQFSSTQAWPQDRRRLVFAIARRRK